MKAEAARAASLLPKAAGRLSNSNTNDRGRAKCGAAPFSIPCGEWAATYYPSLKIIIMKQILTGSSTLHVF